MASGHADSERSFENRLQPLGREVELAAAEAVLSPKGLLASPKRCPDTNLFSNCTRTENRPRTAFIPARVESHVAGIDVAGIYLAESIW
jgi:hypothetical protein